MSIHESDLQSITLQTSPSYKLIKVIGGVHTTSIFANNGNGNLIPCSKTCKRFADIVVLDIDHLKEKSISGSCVEHLNPTMSALLSDFLKTYIPHKVQKISG